MAKSPSNKKSPKGTDESSRPYDREVNPLVLILTLVAAAAISFVAGRSAVLHDLLPIVTNEVDSNVKSTPHDDNNEHPTISLHAGKTAPQYKYSGMEFNISSTKGSAVNTHLPSTLSTSQQVCTSFANGEKRCVIDNTIGSSVNGGQENQVEKECFHDEENCEMGESGDGEDDEEEHLPAGQHLLVDIKNVDSEFLNSDVRLAKAMVDVVNLSQLTLLSYHCHNLIPQGVSCVGVLLESHISFHTWPEAGVITLDLFTCGSGKLVPLVPIVEKLFAIPAVGSLVEPITRWVHKLRGFRPDDYEDILTKDLGVMLEEVNDIKKEVGIYMLYIYRFYSSFLFYIQLNATLMSLHQFLLTCNRLYQFKHPFKGLMYLMYKHPLNWIRYSSKIRHIRRHILSYFDQSVFCT